MGLGQVELPARDGSSTVCVPGTPGWIVHGKREAQTPGCWAGGLSELKDVARLFRQSGKRFPLNEVNKHRHGLNGSTGDPPMARTNPPEPPVGPPAPKSLCLPQLVRHKGRRVSSCNVSPIHSEQLFFEMADRMAEDGWRELGYEYINIDDCWSARQRDAAGQLVPDPKRFPSGIKALADYVHARGLKLGIYGDLGIFTCGGYPGTMLEHVKQDAQTFAAWGVDMLKLDGCYSSAEEQAKGYPEMARALNATGRPIVYSCSWPAYQGGLPPKVNYTILAEICNLWRNYDDIQDSWDSVLSIMDWFFTNQDVLQPAAGPGHWNDPDMLIIGNFGLSYEQSRSQMALWTVMAAPLLMSTDLRTISPGAKEILQNRLMIQINQDPLGIQGRRIVKEKSHIEVFLRPLSQAASALVFFSRRTDMPFRYTTSLAKLHFPEDAVYEVQDVYVGKIIGALKTADNFSVIINPSGVVMWYLRPMALPVQPWHVVRQQAPGKGFHPALL